MADRSSVLTLYGIVQHAWAKPLAQRFFHCVFLTSIAIMPCSGLAQGIPLEKITLIALAPLEARAVVKLPSGRLLTVKPGDELPGAQATVRAVLNEKLVLAEPAGDPTSRRQVWLHKATKPGGPSTIQYLERTPPPRLSVHKPVFYPTSEIVEDSRILAVE